MSLQTEADLILDVLYRDFKQTEKSIGCFKEATPHGPEYYDPNYDPIDYPPYTQITNEAFIYKGLNKNSLFKDNNFESEQSFKNALYYLEITMEYIEYSDSDLDTTPYKEDEWQLSADQVIGKGPHEFIRLTWNGYLEADKNNAVVDDQGFEQYFYFDDKTFYIKTVSGPPKPINLSNTGSRGTSTYRLLYALVNLLRRKGIKTADGWCMAELAPTEILGEVNSQFNLKTNKDWLGNTKSNLLHKTVPSDVLGYYIDMSTYNKSKGFYTFKIKLPN